MDTAFHLDADIILPAIHPRQSLRHEAIELVERKRVRTKAETAEAGPSNVQIQNVEITAAKSSTVPEIPVVSRSKIRLGAVILALYCTLFIAALNATIVATSIPTICAYFNSASGYAWIGGAYVLANGASAPIWSKLSDIWGRKIILLTAVAFYFASCIFCGLSSSMKMLIIARAFQGTAGGGLVQLVNITISDLFSMRERSLYLGYLEVMWGIAGGVGPVLGGAFSEYVSWRWCFWINLPVSGAAFMLLFFFLDVHNPRTKFLDGVKAIDWFGSLSMLALMVMLLLGLDFGGTTFPWNSSRVIGLIVAGCVMLLFFIFSEKILAKYPIMPLDLLQDRSTIAILVVGFAHDYGVIAAEYYLPLYFQSVRSATPLRSGLLMLPLVLTQSISGIATGVLIHRTGRFLELLRLGTLLMTLGAGLYIHLVTTSSLTETIIFQIVSGCGAGLLFEPPLLAIQAVASQEATATATSSLGTARNVATALSIVLGGAIFQNGMQRSAAELAASGLPESVTELLTGDAAAANVGVVGMIKDPVQKAAVVRAFATSLRDMWIMYACVQFLGVVGGLFTKHAVLSEEFVEARTGLKRDDDLVVPT